MNRYPVIGISCRFAVDEAWCPPLVGIRQGYVNAVVDAGGIPLLIPPQLDERRLRQAYESLDGVLLPGGVDVAPELYGEQPHPQLGAVEPLRDRAELLLARWSVQDHKPLLAICRGLQVLNVALGGSLYQDLPSQLPDALDHQSGDRCQSWTVLDHEMLLEPDSRLAELLGTDRLAVNSLHHQGIKQLGRGLTITGRAPDGVIEAIEMRDGGWVVAVQCHPEELWYGADERWRNVFGAFVEAAGGPHLDPSPVLTHGRGVEGEGRGVRADA